MHFCTGTLTLPCALLLLSGSLCALARGKEEFSGVESAAETDTLFNCQSQRIKRTHKTQLKLLPLTQREREREREKPKLKTTARAQTNQRPNSLQKRIGEQTMNQRTLTLFSSSSRFPVIRHLLRLPPLIHISF